jgi:enoyl-CoA hydratase/carnithine racemase
MTMPPVLLQQDGVLARLVLNRPDRRNALDDALIDALDVALREVAAAPECRAVVLTGAGSAFCAGGDMAANSEVDVAGALARQHRFLAVGDRLLRLPKPTVAAVNGAAIGAGLSLALLCDEVVVHRAAKLSFGFLPLGLPPDLFSAVTVQRRAGWTVATDLFHTGRLIPADEAVRLRLAHEAVDDALSAASSRAKQLARLSPAAFAATKALLRHAVGPIGSGTDVEAFAVAAAVGTEEFKNATAQFRARRGGSRPREVAQRDREDRVGRQPAT